MPSLSPSSKKGTVLALVIFACFSFLLVAGPLAAQAQNYGLDDSAREAKLPMDSDPAKNLPSRIGTIVGIALSFVGVIFLILIIYAGVMWMTAAGNDQQVAKAKDIIIASVIGLVIVLSAYAITRFVGTNLAN